MVLKLYKLTFNTAHFGEGTLNESVAGFDVSRLYSALFLEALKLGKEDDFFHLTNQKDFLLSDAYPYRHEPYLPKPIGYPLLRNDEQEEDLKKIRQEAKKVKKIDYIPLSMFAEYVKGNGDVDQIVQMRSEFARTSYLVKKGEDPYEVGLTSFKESLYVLATSSPLFDTLMESLQYSGLGGKRSSGYGGFVLEIEDAPSEIADNVVGETSVTGVFMALATSLPTVDELSEVIKNSKYLLKRAGGFAYSEHGGEQLRKQDLYRFKAGSTFEKTYRGQIKDVRPTDFSHPVWCYAKGTFYRLAL